MISLGHATIFFDSLRTLFGILYTDQIGTGVWYCTWADFKGLLFERLQTDVWIPIWDILKQRHYGNPNQFTCWSSRQWRPFSVIFFVFFCIEITFLLANPYVCGSGLSCCWWVAYPYRPSVTSVYLLLLLKSHSCRLDHARSYFLGHIVIFTGLV